MARVKTPIKQDTNGHDDATQDMTGLAPVSNDGEDVIEAGAPYTARVTAEGTAALLFHAWSVEAVAEKAAAAKGSKSKKTDAVESYVYRNSEGFICIPGEYFRQSIIGAAKYRQAPRSPRKSMVDLFKAGLIVVDELCSLGSKQWDYLDARRVKVQLSAITRLRPAFLAGWRATFRLEVLLPEYISPQTLNATIQQAGKLIGTGDFRPTFGRYAVVQFEVEKYDS